MKKKLKVLNSLRMKLLKNIYGDEFDTERYYKYLKRFIFFEGKNFSSKTKEKQASFFLISAGNDITVGSKNQKLLNQELKDLTYKQFTYNRNHINTIVSTAFISFYPSRFAEFFSSKL